MGVDIDTLRRLVWRLAPTRYYLDARGNGSDGVTRPTHVAIECQFPDGRFPTFLDSELGAYGFAYCDSATCPVSFETGAVTRRWEAKRQW